MAVTKQWLSGTRQGQLDMGILWMTVFPEKMKDADEKDVQKRQTWGIPEDIFTDFGMKVDEAQAAHTEAKNDEKRTKVVNKKVATTSKAMTASMRMLKRRFFHIPPLSEADYVSLGLTVPDTTHTISGVPTAQVIVETYLVGRHQLGLRFIYVTGDANDATNKVFCIYYKVVAHGEKAPERPEELSASFPERRKAYVQNFDFGDSGKTVYYCVQVENGKNIGPWSPMSSALIP